jgi:uncharacterized protein (DUF362 family)
MSHHHPFRGRVIDAPSLVEEFHARELSRRALIKNALAVSAGAALVGCSNGRDGGTDGGTGTPDGGTLPADAGTDAGPPPSHLVGMGYHETDYFAALDAALAETVGLSFIRPGDTVYFKVNCNNFDLYPHSTKPELIVELINRCRDLGATRFIVGDRSFWGDPNTANNMERNGVADAARDAGAELVVFEDADVEWVAFEEVDAPTWNGGFRLPVPVTSADHIINLPCVKTHFIATFTMSLKNVLGLVNPVDRRRTGNLDVHRYPQIFIQTAEVNAFITPSLNILDGYQALITGGPTRTDGAGASYADPKAIIVSTDRIAADVTGIAVLQTLSPSSEEVTQSAAWANPQISYAVEHGNGITSPAMYDLSGPTVPEIETYRDLATRV